MSAAYSRLFSVKKNVENSIRQLSTGQHDHRHRLSTIWTPAQKHNNNCGGAENSHDLLVRAGFVRQTHAGIFHLLPLGLRVQNKIERLIDKHMTSIGASKVSLSSISSEDLWQRSGRLDKTKASDLLRFEDRKRTKFLLAPTHEEEVTQIVADAIHSWKDLPLRLYQVSRKYRDEPRPRQGLLRGREFLMKDLYTFDVSDDAAKLTYKEVQKAYAAFLDELRLPYLVASADSGNMGGDLSHEFHFESPHGEDTVISCTNCEYTVNEEKYIGDPVTTTQQDVDTFSAATFLSRDQKHAVRVVWPGEENDVNLHVVKILAPYIDTTYRLPPGSKVPTSTGDLEGIPTNFTVLSDPRMAGSVMPDLFDDLPFSKGMVERPARIASIDGKAVSLTKAKDGDPCPECDVGQLRLRQAVEIGHTFHLGTRYSTPLQAQVRNAEGNNIDMSMGCHGIGVSRLIAATSSLMAHSKGLGWPLAIAPFGMVIIAGMQASEADINTLYDDLVAHRAIRNTDAVIDDRNRPLGWKLNDADLIGYPFIIVLGRAWEHSKCVELQCHQLGIKELVNYQELGDKIQSCIQKL